MPGIGGREYCRVVCYVHASEGKEDASMPAIHMLTGHQTDKYFRARPAMPEAIIVSGEDVGCSKFVVNGPG